jgi:hypothetical protein
MNTLELKRSFHSLIDSIENEKLLSGFYELIRKRVSGKEGKLWEKLTDEERNELLLAFEESEEDDNLISNRDMKKKHEKWL